MQGVCILVLIHVDIPQVYMNVCVILCICTLVYNNMDTDEWGCVRCLEVSLYA